MLSPATARWLEKTRDEVAKEGFEGEVLEREVTHRVVFAYLTAAALCSGKFIPDIHPSVVREHSPVDDQDWNRLFGRLCSLSRDRWIQKYIEHAAKRKGKPARIVDPTEFAE
jgi:hypothetical protein